MRQVICLQGIPGSGKSTMAKNWNRAAVVSADEYMVGEDNIYLFEANRLLQCHAKCFNSFLSKLHNWICLEDYLDVVIVDNVNSRPEHVSPYALGAAAFGFDFKIIRMDCPRELALSRNIHNVPSHTVARLDEEIRNFRPMMGWKIEVVKP